MLRTKIPDGAARAAPFEMTAESKKVKLKSYSPDMFQDLLNVSRDAEVLSNADIEEACRELIAQGQSTVKAKDFIHYETNVAEFLREVKKQRPFDKFSGSNIEKIAQLLKFLSQEGEGTEETTSDLLPIFSEREGKEIAQNLIDSFMAIEEMTDEERQLLNIEMVQGEEVADQAIAMGKRAEAIMLRLSRMLDDMTPLSITREKKAKTSKEPTNWVRTRGIKQMEELPRIQKVAWSLPAEVFWQRAVDRRLPVREFVEFDTRKQLIYLLLDVSSSMSMDLAGGTSRIDRACGIALNRLKGVMKGDAELYFRTFAGSCGPLTKIDSPETAKTLFEKVKDKSIYHGGSTDWVLAVNQALEDIHGNEEAFHRCDIVMITDGTGGKRSEINLGAIKLHVFSVDMEDVVLKEAATTYHVV